MKHLTEKIIAAILAALCCGPVMAQDWMDGLPSKPGYVDFGNLTELFGQEPKVEVMLGGPLVTFLAEASRQEDPELAKMLDGLTAISVNVYELDQGDAQAARDRVEQLAGRLSDQQWQRTVKVNEEDSRVQMFMRTDGDQIAGLALMVLGGDSEAVFINVVGNVDPAALGKLASKFGVSADINLN